MGARSRRKGAAWERELAGRFRALGIYALRNLEEVRSGNSGDLMLRIPLSVQAKVGARPPIYEAVTQAQEAAGDQDVPVAMIRRNGAGSRPPDDLAVMPLDSFFEIVGALVEAGIWREEG